MARQTWHVLKMLHRREDCRLAIVSYNPGARLWAGMIGLTLYVPSERIVTLREPAERHELVRAVLPPSFDPAVDSLYYFDDRIDNIADVRAVYPTAKTFEVRDPRTMHLQVKSAFPSGWL